MYAHGVQAPSGIDRQCDLILFSQCRWDSQPVRDGGHRYELTGIATEIFRTYPQERSAKPPSLLTNTAVDNAGTFMHSDLLVAFTEKSALLLLPVCGMDNPIRRAFNEAQRFRSAIGCDPTIRYSLQYPAPFGFSWRFWFSLAVGFPSVIYQKKGPFATKTKKFF